MDNQWEKGTVVLPAEHVEPVHALLRATTEDFIGEVLRIAHTLHEDVPQENRADPKKYRATLWGVEVNSELDGPVPGLAEAVMHHMCYLSERLATDQGVQPVSRDILRQEFTVTHSHDEEGFSWVGAPGAVTVGDYLWMNGNTITWDVFEGSECRQELRESLTGKALFGYLDTITDWPEGTGGLGVGNDEANMTSTELGGAANYATFRFGPLSQ